MSAKPLQRLARAALISLLVSLSAVPLQAQTAGPTLQVMRVESANAPDYTVQVSVVGPEGRAIAGLAPSAFELSDISTGQPIPLQNAQASNGGIAVMIVADLAGLDNTRDFGQVNLDNLDALMRQFLSSLQAQSQGQDYVGLIAMRSVGEEKVAVFVPPTNDLAAVVARLPEVRNARVDRLSALFDGVNQALNALTRNADAAVQAALDQRRKIILVFSDGADNKFSDEGIRGDIIRRANQTGVSIFTVQVNQRQPREFTNMKAMADQTGGAFALFDQSVDRATVDAQVADVFARVNSQRTQYALSFRLVRPAGTHTAQLKVNTPFGSAVQEFRFTSNLQPPRVTLIAPSDGFLLAQTTANAADPVTLQAEVIFPDGKPRPVTVEFFVNGVSLQKVDTPPYAVTWQPAREDRSVVTKTIPYSLLARVTDSYLETTAESQSVRGTLEVAAVPAVPFVPMEAPSPEQWLRQNPGVAAFGCALTLVVIGLIIALIVLNQRYANQFAVLRANIAKGVQSGVRMVTQRLGINRQPLAELKVIAGPMTGASLPIAAESVWVGRDPTQCEVVLLSDPYVSGRHFQITRDPVTQQFFITDGGASNGTRLNRTPLQPQVRVPLPPDSEIEAGMTRMIFQVGRKTQRLNP
ncbi:MAG: FHA domain-containing protein [Thermoflexales bacterium]|nr:FHA domain-containing protein [Thermoflexales bacterium]MDW8292134.1 FHA domain-containing protein [Anaerolineae bacterium]